MPDIVRGTEILKQQLAKIGIDVQIRLADYGAISVASTARPATFQVFMGTIAQRGDPDKSNYFATTSPTNNLGWGSAKLDALLPQGMSEANEQKRIVIYKQINEELYALANDPPLFMTKQFAIAAPQLRDWQTGYLGTNQRQFEQLKYAWFDK